MGTQQNCLNEKENNHNFVHKNSLNIWTGPVYKAAIMSLHVVHEHVLVFLPFLLGLSRSQLSNDQGLFGE